MEMLASKNITPTQTDQHVKTILQGLASALNENIAIVNGSKNFLDLGVRDQLANYFANHIDNPLNMVSHTLEGHFSTVRDILESIATGVFVGNKDSIKNVYRTNDEGNFLQYYIILKKDSLKNRRSLLAFLNFYNKERLSSQFPIYFDFVNSKLEGGIKKAKEIKISNAEAPQSSKI